MFLDPLHQLIHLEVVYSLLQLDTEKIIQKKNDKNGFKMNYLPA